MATPWLWTLAAGQHEDRWPKHGYEATREAAMATFTKKPTTEVAVTSILPSLNYQPAILINVGDGTTTRFEDAPAPKGRGVLLDGNEDIVREC